MRQLSGLTSGVRFGGAARGESGSGGDRAERTRGHLGRGQAVVVLTALTS